MPEAVPIIIVCRDNLALTKKTLASVLAQDVPVDILVVNNSSADSSATYLQTKPVSIIHTGEQWALARCWNTGLRWFWNRGYTEALVLNNDLEILPWTARTLKSHGGPFVTSVSVNTRDQFESVRSSDMDELRKTEREHPDYSCFLIRKAVTDRNLWFDEECFPAYLEDSFHHKAMFDAGITAVCISLPFLHHSACTLKTASVHDQRIIREGADRSRERFRKRYGCVPGTKEYEALFFRETLPV